MPPPRRQPPVGIYIQDVELLHRLFRLTEPNDKSLQDTLTRTLDHYDQLKKEYEELEQLLKPFIDS